MKAFLKKIGILIALTMVISITAPNFLPVFNSVQTAKAATIKINKKGLELFVGDTYKLKISGTKAKVTWKSSKKSVATVSKAGTVTAKEEGTATITATVSGKKYTCKVTVKVKELSDNDMIAYGWILLKDSLKNPDSLKIHSIKVGYEDAEYGDGTIVEGQRNVLFDYSAQNGYGGMNRKYAAINFYPFDGEPYLYYSTITSDAFDGYLVLSHYTDEPEFYDVKKIKIKDIEPLVEKYLDEENYETY